jgi:hypothetical protein
MNEEKWNLPPKFAPTPELLQKSDEQQQELKKRLNFVIPTIKEAFFRNAEIRAKEIEELFKNGAEKTEYLRRLLAENYATIGEYEKAAVAEPDLNLCLEYAEINHALNLPDAERTKRCRCIPPEHIQQNITPFQEVFSRRDGRFIELQRCVMCKQITVKKV